MVKVTIGLCAKNSEETVGRAIESIVDQDFPHEPLEAIFVDDGSEDGTLSILSDYAAKMDMPTFVFSSEWRGLGAARQTVVDKARGEYIVWVDSDIILPKDHVRKQVEFMEQNPKVGAARGVDAHDWLIKDGIQNPKEINPVQFLEYLGRLNYIYEKDAFESRRDVLGVGGGIYRSKAIKEVGGFDRQIRGAGEDNDITARMKKAGWLLYLNRAEFYQTFRKTWKALWDQYFWYGYGAHYVYHKHKGLITLWHWIPVVAFASGIRRSIKAYKVTRRKAAFLSSFHFAFKKLAWCLGFAKSHMNKYRPPE